MAQKKKEPDALTRAMGDVLRGLARQQRISQRDLAKKTGISFSSVQRYLAGDRNIWVTDLGILARALGSSVSEVTHDAQAILDARGGDESDESPPTRRLGP